MKLLFRIAKEAVRYKGLLLIAMLSTVCLTGVNLTAPKVMTRMISLVEGGMEGDALSRIRLLALALLGLYLVKVLFRYLSNFMAHKAAWELVQDLRLKVYDHIQSFSMGFFHDRQTGDLMSRVVNDTANFEQLFAHIIPDMITNMVTLVGVTTILLFTNARLTLLTCIPIPFILASGWFFAHKVRPNFRAMQKSLAGLNSQLQDNFSGIQEIQAFNQEQRSFAQVEEKASMFTASMLRALNLSAVFHPGVEFLTSMGTVIVVGFGGYMAFRGQLGVADIVGFYLYLALFYAPIAGIANLLESAQSAYAGAERVIEILDTPREIQDAPDAKPMRPVRGEVAFEHVDFSYIPGTPVLKDISFIAKPGQMIALVGPTGVGKTTAVQLAARFYDPVGGRVLVDGQDISRVTVESLRENISMVLQDTFLFNGTVAENIAYARPRATLEEIVSAAKIARIHEAILEMPQGYDTLVGERGAKLSGGQKQRIAIARAVLRNAPILILDEATASVDVETEAEIQLAIGELAGSRTIIAIAHRLSTVRRADLILVFENGEIVQRGNHNELMAQDGLYRRLCRAQERGALLSQGDLA